MINQELEFESFNDCQLEQKIEEWQSNVDSSITPTGRECSQEILDNLKVALANRS